MNAPATRSRLVRVRGSALALAFAIVSGCQLATPIGQAAPKLRFDAGAFSVVGLPADAARRLKGLAADSQQFRDLFSVSIEGGDGTPMLGSYALSSDAGKTTLTFTPRFPVSPGASYLVRFDPSKLAANSGERQQTTFRMPKPPSPPPAVVSSVYPSSERLPENLLRIYLHFSAPMRRGEAYDHIRLLDSAGKVVATPFVTFGEELWDESGKRLTLFLDPGRVKSGLKPREDAGPVLEQGKRYTLVVDTGWRDASGQHLAREFRKAFAVVDPILTGIEPAKWKIEAPAAGTKANLVVRFPRPLDHALLQHVLHVMDPAGQPVAGAVAVDANETVWRFAPGSDWRPGRYGIEIEAILEDVAGNRVGRPFEIDEARAAAPDRPPARLSFVVK